MLKKIVGISSICLLFGICDAMEIREDASAEISGAQLTAVSAMGSETTSMTPEEIFSAKIKSVYPKLNPSQCITIYDEIIRQVKENGLDKKFKLLLAEIESGPARRIFISYKRISFTVGIDGDTIGVAVQKHDESKNRSSQNFVSVDDDEFSISGKPQKRSESKNRSSQDISAEVEDGFNTSGELPRLVEDDGFNTSGGLEPLGEESE